MHRPAPRRALIPVKRMCTLVIALWLLTLIVPQSTSLAQEAPEPTAEVTSETTITTEAPVLSTDIPTVAAPETTDAAPVAETPVPTDPAVQATAEATALSTAEPTAEATTAPLTSFAETFTNWTGAGWDVVEWLVQTEDDGSAYLLTSSSFGSATIQNLQVADFQLTAKLRITENNIAEILVRSGLENYRLMFSAQGASRLMRGDTLLAASSTAPLPLPTAEMPAPQWFTVTITAVGATLGVSVNDVPQIAYTDPLPLPAGTIAFTANANNTGEIAIDDVSVVTVDPLTTVIATPAAPAATAEATLSVEPTLEATADATIEATAEATVEATVEATAEATHEAPAFSTVEAKLPETLRGAFELYATGDTVGADALLAEQQVYPDDRSRIYIVVVHDETEDIASLIVEGGGEIVSSRPNQVKAYIPLATIIELVGNPSVTAMYLPPRATSTGPVSTGSTSGDYMESFDALGATDWHNAGILGQTSVGGVIKQVNIAVIDTGFAKQSDGTNPVASGDFSCLKQTTVRYGLNSQKNGDHGRSVIEVLCDIAPKAAVYLYQASDYDTLGLALAQARADSFNGDKNDIILITMDLGASVSPGDGDGVTASQNDPYTQLQQAHDDGIITIVAAGNNGNNGVNGVISLIDSTPYIAYTHSGGTTNITVQFAPVAALAGNPTPINTNGIHVGYQSSTWTSDSSLSISLSGGISADDGVGTAGRHFSIPACTTALPTGCQYTLSISGGGTKVVQVQATGTGIIQNPAGITGYLPNAGNLGRPADSPYVITVGAVCADYKQNYPIYPESSRGPIYGADGAAPAALINPATTALTRNTVKPDIVSFSNVRTSVASPIYSNGYSASWASSTTGNSCAGGFGGTSAAASHVAGMVALMLSVVPDVNPSMTANTPTSFDRSQFGNAADAVDNVLDYLQSHSVEMPYGTGPATANSVEKPDESVAGSLVGANGYDMVYGAGLAVLGSPFYDLTKSVNYTAAPDDVPQSTSTDGDQCNNLVYVGQGNPGGAQDGTINNPFVSIAYAYNRAGANDCIIVMPGEYVSPLLLQPYRIGGETVLGRSIYSYDDVRVDDPGSSIFWMNTQYFHHRTFNPGTGTTFVGAVNGTAQIVFDFDFSAIPTSSNRTVISGFNFIPTQMLGTVTATVNTSNSGDSISEPQGVILYNAKDVTLRNSTFGEVTLTYDYGDTSKTPASITYRGLGTDDPSTPAVQEPLIGVAGTMITALSGSDGLIVEGNSFVRNKVGIVGGARAPIMFVDSSGTNSGSGYDTDRVRFALNLVDGNVNTSDKTNRSWSSILKAKDSAIDITDNTFVQNIAETIISTATADATNALETRILGNVFLSNTATTPAGEGDAGPIVQLFYVRNLYFINNTVVKNTATGNKYGALLLRGDPRPDFLGSMTNASEQVWEVHNNIFYNNSIARGIADDAIRVESPGATYKCDNLANISNAGAQKNWLFGNGVDNSACGAVFSTNPIGNGNDTTTNPAPYFMGNDASLALDPVKSSVYYALNNGGSGSAFDGVDAGGTTLGGSIINSSDFNRDADGGARLVPTSVDIGAFEFETLKFVDGLPNPLPAINISEDTVGIVSLDQLSYLGNPIVSGGSGTLSFEVVVGPEDYGTQCTGGTFNDSNRGVQVAGKLLKYCPPRNFYTDDGTTSTPANINGPWQDSITVQFKVRDASGQRTPTTATLQFNITPVNDANLSGSYSYVVTSSRSRIAVQLRPYVTFTAAGGGVSTFGTPYAPKFSNVLAADYPYSYSSPTLVDEPGDEDSLFTAGELTNAFSEMQTTLDNTNRTGLIYIDVTPNLPGYKKFSYTVTDRRGNSATYTVTVRVASTIPSDGLYDDTSFAFTYDDSVLNETSATNITMGKWEATTLSTAINNTIHRTSTLDDQFSVEYKGTGFVLYMRSAGINSSSFDIDIFQGDTAVTMSNWTTNASGLRQSTLSGVTSGGICYTRAPFSTLNAGWLNGNIATSPNFTVTCEGMDVAPGNLTYTVRVKNKTQGGFLTVDAISIINPAAVTGTVLTPGYYDVDSKLVRDLFSNTAQWTALTSPTVPRLSNSVAMGTIINGASAGSAQISFKLRRATGFAIETALDLKSPTYLICVAAESAPSTQTCQKYTNTSTAFIPNIFRPFYGLDTGTTYIVTISIDGGVMPAGARLLIDSITVFGDSERPSGPLPLSNIDDLRFDWFVLGGGREDGWAFNGAATTSLNSTLTTSSNVGTGRYAGPFLAFQMPQAADAFILKYTYNTTLSTSWMVCVDRVELDTNYGNCLLLNPRATGTTPTYQRINPTTGAVEAATQNVMLAAPISNQPLQGTFLIRESMFGTNWSASTHTVEIFSLLDAAINFDVITPLDTSNSFQPGYYEEITPGLHYFSKTTIDNDTEMGGFTPLATQPWSQILLASHSGGGALQTKQKNASVAFNMSGASGFAPRLQLSNATDALKVCWKSPEATIDSARVQDVLATGTCQVVDTEALVPVYKVDRPFFGFNRSSSYTVVIQSIGDLYTPAPRPVSPVPLIWDGISILGTEYDASTLTALTPNAVTEFNFKTRVADNKFLYFGSTWATREGAAAPGRSASNFDFTTGLGSSVVFKVASSSADDALIFLRDTSLTASDLEVCATNSTYTTRTCSTIETNTAAGVKVPGLFYLPGTGTYYVSVTALNNAVIILDAVQHVVVNTTLQEGRYEDTDPRLRYGTNGTDLVLNGNMETAAVTGWFADGTATLTATPPVYLGARSLRLSGFTAGSGVRSTEFALQSGVPYTVVGRVSTSVKFGAKITMQLYNTLTSTVLASQVLDTADAGILISTWHPIRIDYTPSTSAAQVVVRFIVDTAPPTAAAYIYVDDVSVTRGSNWDVFPGTVFTNGTVTRSSTHGAQMTFTFTGTGFNIGTIADTLGGKMEICYGAGSTLPLSPTCMTYVNEATTASRTLTRGVSGLSAGTYTVRVRDVEEGYLDTITALTNYLTRASASRVGRIAIDFVDVFDVSLTPAITTSSTLNDNAVDGSGNAYIQYLPANRWRTLTDTLAVGRSNSTVAAQVDPTTNNITSVDGGTEALFRINIPTSSDAQIIVNTGVTAGTSNTLLVCVDAVAGDLNYDNVLKRQVSALGATNCTVVTTTTSLPFFAVNKSQITRLGISGPHTVTIRTLTPGFFYIDGLSVLYGSAFIPGYYENSQSAGTSDLMTGATPANWVTEANALYSGGYALTTTNTAETLTLHLTNSTGLTVFTASGPQNKGIDITVDSDTNANVYTKTVTLAATAGYKVPVTIAGLPVDDYTVTIKMPVSVVAPAKLTVDAIEVYGALQALGSLYDDASVNPANKLAYLTYTPNTNAAWSFVSGTAAAGHLEQTYHQTRLLDAGVAFKVGKVSELAQGLIIHYGATTNTSIRVCLTPSTGVGTQTCSSDIVLLGTAGKSRLVSFSDSALFTTPPGDGIYNVSIVNAAAAKVFTLDAVQVVEAGVPLAEGLYDALFLNSAGLLHAGSGTWTAPTVAANKASGTPGTYVEFTFTGIGFSLILNESTATAGTYSLCIVAGTGPCTTPVALNEHTASITRGAFVADYALSATGLQINTNQDNTYTVRVTNTAAVSTQTLIVKSLHIMGYRAGMTLTSADARVENNDPRLRYLPFGSLTETVIKTAPTPSGFSQHQGALRGAGVYFEFVGGGFEYGRQTSLSFGGYNYCYAAIVTTGTPSFTCQPSTAGSNLTTTVTVPAGMQRVDTISTSTTCQNAPGCWVRLYSTDNRLLPVDFIRIVDDVALSAGTYEENHPSLRSVLYNGSFSLDNLPTTPVNNAAASGGILRLFKADSTPSALNGGLAFLFHGTGFGINFARNAFSDAVRICYAPNITLPMNGGDIDSILAGDCVDFDNFSATPLYNQMRAIQGLPENDYGVFVQMRDDNYRAPNSLTPQTHIGVTQTPLQMLIDNVTIFNDPVYDPTNTSWAAPAAAALEVLTPGTVYEPSYTNRLAQNRFWYNGPWTTLAVTGGYADWVALAGSGMTFRTQGASAMTLYVTATAATGPIMACARPIDTSANPAILDTGEKSHCQLLQTRGAGNRYAIPFRFVDNDNSEYIVSITTVENTIVQIDALELFDVLPGMQPGTYESSSPFFDYTEMTPTDNIVPNGGFASTCAPWTADTNTTAIVYSLFTDGTTSCLVAATQAGKGIQSPSFTLQATKAYTLVARVYVLASTNVPELQMRTTNAVGITTTSESRTGKWYTIRQDFVVSSNTSTQLRFESKSGGTTKFVVDGVWLLQKGTGQWDQVYNALYSGTSAMRSSTPGAQISFNFTGTGFSVKMPTDANSGEVDICYGVSTADTCFTYQQDSVAATYDVSRVVAGLPLGSYTVTITEKDDGLGATTAVTTPRIPLGISIDSVTIFGAEGLPATVTQIGQYEQDAKNPSGTPYIAKLPAANWRDFAATTWTGGTASQVTTPAGIVSYTNAGATAVMILSNTLANPTLIVYNRVPTGQSTTLLICASSNTLITLLKPDISGSVIWNGTGLQLPEGHPKKCYIHNLRSGNQITLTSSELVALGAANQFKLVTFTTLTPGGFNLDAFEVIADKTLPAGMHDQIKPDSVLNFNSSSNPNSQIGTTNTCNPRLGWCTLRSPAYYGGSAAYTRQRGSTVNFSFQGTGFSIISSVNSLGADMRICVAPSSASNPFPSDNNIYYGNPAGFNQTWCDVVTTKLNASEWFSKNPDRYVPDITTNQYGFAYYGLQADTYNVEVRLIDTSISTFVNDYLLIDAVAIFGNEPDVLSADGREQNLFDDRQSQLLYEPSANWTATTTTTQPPLFKTEMRASKAGSIVRLKVDGNAVTIYQTMVTDRQPVYDEFGTMVSPFIPSYTRDMRVCLMVGDGPIPCEPEAMEIGERATTGYRQSAMNGAAIPILIYGLGPGEHNLIIENRDIRTMSIDAFRVLP